MHIAEISLKDTHSYQEIAKEEGMNILKRLLVHRFGELPKELEQHLEQATIEQIEQWADYLFDVPSLTAIFKKSLH